MKRPLVLLALAGMLSMSPAAPVAAAAKNSSQIANIGIRSFDKVFREARQINNTLTSAQQTRTSARQNLNSVLGLSPKSSFESSLRELRSRADGKIKVVSRGGTPTLQASDAVPSDVSSAISAANSAITDYKSLLTSLADLPEDCQALAKRSRSLSVADLRSEAQITSISDISTRFQQVRTMRSNLDTMQKMPNKSQRLMSNLRGDVAAVSSVFPSR
jgi:hypothetical protein